MAFAVTGPATDPSHQPKPRRNARLQQAQAVQANANPCTVPDDGHQVTAPPRKPVTGAAPTRLIPLTDWNQHHAWPPIGGLRHLVFFERTNGFHKVVRRVGRRVLLDEAAFFTWVESDGGHHASV